MQASPADLLPSVHLPRGSGAIRGPDERFSVNADTETASMAVPLPLSPGSSGFTLPAVHGDYGDSSMEGDRRYTRPARVFVGRVPSSMR